ncbi:MAG TPA: RNA polymerase sigma factor [Actinomycetota bacterium]|nr:RNA polymerase sigma factor [Actinomycetota bacterium]
MEGRPLDENHESELIERARDGDVGAYEELVRMHQAIVYRTAYFVTGSADDAEDVAQAAFIKAFRALGAFRPDAPFKPWLLTIVANEARNTLRAAGRRKGLGLRLSEDRPRVDAAPSPEATILREDDRGRLLAALDELDERSRAVVTCRYLLELSEAETAAVLGCPQGTVKSRLARALDKLRATTALEADLDG